MTAARTALIAETVAGIPWPERVLAVRLPALGGLEVVNVHSPVSPKPDLAKVRTHEAVFRHLATRSEHPRLVCGDLNTPRREHADGTVWTFARTRAGKAATRPRRALGRGRDRADPRPRGRMATATPFAWSTATS